MYLARQFNSLCQQLGDLIVYGTWQDIIVIINNNNNIIIIIMLYRIWRKIA